MISVSLFLFIYFFWCVCVLGGDFCFFKCVKVCFLVKSVVYLGEGSM